MALCGALAYILAFLPQSQEYLALIRETASHGLTVELGFKYFVNVTYYLLFCFLMGKSFQDNVTNNAYVALSTAKRFIFSLVFFVLFALPVLVVLHAMLDGHKVTLQNLVAIGIALLVLLGVVMISLKMSGLTCTRCRRAPARYIRSHSLWVCVLLLTFLFAANSFDIVRGSRLFGTIGIITGTLAFLQGALFVLAHYWKRGYPVLSIFVTALLVGHLISHFTGPRYLDTASSAPKSVPATSAGFQQWLNVRRDQIVNYGTVHPGRKYPVFVVAAQGGGYYAAYHSGLFLARLEDRCPSFADHTFAVSSVSGGSLGAAVFAEGMRLQSQHKVRAHDETPCAEGALAA